MSGYHEYFLYKDCEYEIAEDIDETLVGVVQLHRLNDGRVETIGVTVEQVHQQIKKVIDDYRNT